MIDFDALWDYGDPAGSEVRFQKALRETHDPATKLEIQTQIARTFSLRRQFDESHALLDEVLREGIEAFPRAQVRYLLERGRAFNSSHNKDQARPEFYAAFELADSIGEEALAADAAHMIAIIEPGEKSIEWNIRTIEVAKRATDPKAKKWIASAGNNLGWSYHALGRFDEALSQFEEVAELRKASGGDNYIIARWCVARTLRSLGRYEEALTAQVDLKKEREDLGAPSGFVFEEIGESLLALNRTEESKPFFARAFELLSQDRWIVADEPERLARLQLLSGGSSSVA